MYFFERYSKKLFTYVCKETMNWLNNVNRFKILFFAKRGIQELNYDAFNEIKALELTVYDDLKFVLPSDYVNWVKLSLFKDNVVRDLVENIQVQSATSICANW